MTVSGSESFTNDSFASQYEQRVAKAVTKFRPGSVVSGTVASVGRDLVMVDIGFKSEGIVPIEQFADDEGKYDVQPGDKLEVFILALENEHGQVLLSKEKASQKKVWAQVEEAYKIGSIVSGKVTLKVKGGLQVDMGIPAFLPGSQIDIKQHRNLEKFIGETFDYKVIKITRDKGNVVLSRKAVLVNERDSLRAETIKHLSEGIIIEGTVKNITDYGVFVDLGGIDGLLHITDISWKRLNHPSEKLSVGQVVQVVVLKYDDEKRRVSLGMKQLTPDPWQSIGSRYPEKSRAKGKVTNITDYGAFIELEEGVEGLIHISELSWNKKVKHPSKVLAVGTEVEALVLGLDGDQQRISLSLKQLTPNPWDELKYAYPKGTRVKGAVQSITDFGIFIQVTDDIDGLVHVSDFSWTKRLRDAKQIGDLYKKGDEVDAIVLEVDAEHERLSLGVKQLTIDPWESIIGRFPIGAKIKGKITAVVEHGVYVELEDDLEGLIHNSQLGLEKGQNVSDLYKVGEPIEAEVILADREERRINLSVRSIKRRQEKDSNGGYMGDDVAPITFGDLIRDKATTAGE